MARCAGHRPVALATMVVGQHDVHAGKSIPEPTWTRLQAGKSIGWLVHYTDAAVGGIKWLWVVFSSVVKYLSCCRQQGIFLVASVFLFNSSHQDYKTVTDVIVKRFEQISSVPAICLIGRHISSSFLACNDDDICRPTRQIAGTLLMCCSTIHRHHPPQRAVLSQICCFWERKAVLFRILLDIWHALNLLTYLLTWIVHAFNCWGWHVTEPNNVIKLHGLCRP